jgi:hypothetical protein
MRWFKHMSDALDDIFVQELILKFGGNGYMLFFGLIELIARENGKTLTGKLEVSPAILKQKFHISRGKLKEILEFCQGKGKVLFDNNLENWKLEIPKMLCFKDNYTADLGATSKQLASHIRDRDRDRDKSKEEEKEKKDSLCESKEKALALKNIHGEFQNILLTENELEKLRAKFAEAQTQALIESMSAYLAKTGKTYKSHYAALLTWDRISYGQPQNKTLATPKLNPAEQFRQRVQEGSEERQDGDRAASGSRQWVVPQKATQEPHRASGAVTRPTEGFRRADKNTTGERKP